MLIRESNDLFINQSTAAPTQIEQDITQNPPTLFRSPGLRFQFPVAPHYVPLLQCAGTHAGHLHLYGTLSSAVGKV